jgi:hypothetical protein
MIIQQALRIIMRPSSLKYCMLYMY